VAGRQRPLPVNNQITRVDNLFINLQRQLIEGTDLELSYAFGPFNLRTFVTRLMENSIQNPGGPIDDRAGDIGGASAGLPQLKVMANLSYSNGPFSLFVQQRYVDGGKLDRNLVEGIDIDDNTIDSTMYTDLGVRYALGTNDTWEIFGNVNNLLDQEPRATAQILGRAGVNEFNDGLYDVLGRRIVIGARLSF
jgi:outer membrane receptor protein involved in Fe transport